MNFEIKATEDFRRSLKSLTKRHRSLKHDFQTFTDSIRENPFQGDELSPGIRKIRMAISSKGRGKSVIMAALPFSRNSVSLIQLLK